MTTARPILFILGTRSEAIKTLPIIRALKEHHPDIPVRVGATGQHSILFDQIAEVEGVKLAWNLQAMSGRQVINKLLGKMIGELEGPVRRENPALIVISGDSASALSAALTAHLGRYPLAHIEAGLRGWQPGLPYPEEKFRRMISSCADCHLAPTEEARQNLLAESISAENIHVVGEPALDSLWDLVATGVQIDDPELASIAWNAPLILSTVVRRENHGDAGYAICNAYLQLVQENPRIQVVHVNHLNPHLCDTFWGVLNGKERILVTSPLPRQLFVNLLYRADLVITDSGGVQEEASALGIPIVSLRATQDRGRFVDDSAILARIGEDNERMAPEVQCILETARSNRSQARRIPVVAPRIAELLAGIYRSNLG